MNWKAWAPLAIAIVLGVFAARLAVSLVGNNPTVVAAQETTTPIVVAKHDINPGVTINAAEDLGLLKVDAKAVPVGAFTTIAEVEKRVSKYPLTPGQPILASTLADAKAGTNMSALVPPGMRLVTLEINAISGVAGFIQPKSRVDLISTIQQDGKPTTVTLLQNLEVWAVGQRTSPNPPALQPGQQPEPPASNITLLVKPVEAEKIELATSTSRVRMVIRNGTDTKSFVSTGIQTGDLAKGGSNGASASDPFAGMFNKTPSNNAGFQPTPGTTGVTPTAASWEVEIIRAGTRSNQQFAEDNKNAPNSSKQPTPVTPLPEKNLMTDIQPNK